MATADINSMYIVVQLSILADLWPKSTGVVLHLPHKPGEFL